MKPQPFKPRYPKPPTSPWMALMWVVVLGLIMLFFVIFATGCALPQDLKNEFRETTWSVSYQDESGEIYSVTRVGKPKIRATK